MTTFTVEISETVPCHACGTEVATVTQECPACGAATISIPIDQFYFMVERGQILYAQHGGLVVGRDTLADDIPMFQHAGGAVFRLVGLMQGGEYLMSPAATERHRPRLEEINSEKGPYTPITAVPLTAKTAIINVNFSQPTASLWISQRGQFIINRYATAKYLKELERLNSDT